MRPRVRGMRGSDRHILGYLYNGDQQELVATPAVIAANIDFADATVRERVSTLRDAGLIDYYDEDRAMYQLGELGRKYMEDDLSDEEIEQLEADLKQSS